MKIKLNNLPLGKISIFISFSAIIALLCLLVNLIGLTKSHKDDLVNQRFEFNKEFIQYQLDYLENERVARELWRDEYTIEYLCNIMEQYDKGPGIVARVLDKDFNLLSTPHDVESIITDDVFANSSSEKQEIIKIIEKSSEGTFDWKSDNKRFRLYYRAYPMDEKNIYLIIGVTNKVVPDISIESAITISIGLLVLCLVSCLLYISSILLKGDRKFKENLNDLFKTIKVRD